MTKSKKVIISLAMIGVLFAGGLSYVFAQENASDNAIASAISNNDYSTWKSLMTERFVAKLTQEKFDKIVEIQKLKAEGKTDEAKELAKDLGFEMRKAKQFKRWHKFFSKSETGQEIKKALENNDYNAWKNLVGDRKITEKINQDNFSRFVEYKVLLSQGKFEEAKVIAKELGLWTK